MSHKIKKTLILGVVALLVNIVAVLAWLFIFNKILMEKNQILSVRYQLDEVRLKVNSIKNLEDLLKDIEKDRGSINDSFIGEKDLVQFIKELERVADLSGVSLQVGNANVPRDQKDLGPSFSLVARGNFDGVRRFVSLIGSIPYQVLFETATIQKSTQLINKKETWEARLDVKVLSFTF
ncbi:MAG: hypothetical protein HZC14_00850 [Candidatus Niyogibacteria bacterium]|nr:hypothetical protein [Candidatus Niyogibacteria bacterium]